MRLAYAPSFLSLYILVTIAVLYVLRRSPFSLISDLRRRSSFVILSSLSLFISWMALVLIQGLLTVPYLCYRNSTVLVLYGKAM
ncbi:hypothetical protein RHGRI_029909 [Rhododendron griersonianum]|uniref:Uncharacterized protein n=1 Tax=Rhododendron griersonianum TaxID=479676 RepID=A0AAV6IM16_9ERIC|nr:hypothetical protein RHGRI_029909 [Rhododendron griersonianum]